MYPIGVCTDDQMDVLEMQRSHDNHIEQCLDIEELTQFLKGFEGNQAFKKQQQQVILQELRLQQQLIQQCYQRMEQYLDCITAQEQQLKLIQELCSRMETQSLFELTEEDLNKYLFNFKHRSINQEYYIQLSSKIKEFNAKLDTITKSLQEFVHPNGISVTESLHPNNDVKIIGSYRIGAKIGQWTIINKNGVAIGGGKYNSNGGKHGQWIDIEFGLSSNSLNHLQLIGEYKNGVRIDKWEIRNLEGKNIGGGYYNGEGMKVGDWIEVEIDSQYDKYYTKMECEYENGRLLILQGTQLVEGNIINLGINRDNGQMSNQVYLNISSQQEYSNSLIYGQHMGNYQNGQRIDKWVINDPKGKIIGGGQYNQNGIKVGKWIDVEFSQTLSSLHYVQYIGIYHDGRRIDQWDILDHTGERIGGGQYNQSGNKHNIWIDIELSLSRFKLNYVSRTGSFIDGKRIDHWDIKNAEGKIIGGGEYNENGNKHGQWVDIKLGQSLYFPYYVQHVGKYQDGQRNDHWEIKDHYDETIGGGQYNQSGNKHGLWVDIEFDQSIYNYYYIIHTGKYQDGKQIGEWQIKDRDQTIIGGGTYDTLGNKHQRWVDVEIDNIYGQLYVNNIGKYQGGMKIDEWEIKNLNGETISQIIYTQTLANNQ